MSEAVSDVVEIGTLGLVDDVFGIEAGKGAAREAAGVQVAASQAGIAEQRRQFDVTQAGIQPFQAGGLRAFEQQQALLGIAEAKPAIAERPRVNVFTGEPIDVPERVGSKAVAAQLGGAEAQQAAFAALEVSPGQQFLRDRAQKNLLRNAAAIGGLGGGNVRSALVQQGVGFAQQDIQNQFGRLGQLAGQGQAAATNIGQFGTQTAGNIANLQLAGGEARASGILGAQQAGTQATNQLLQLGGIGLGLFTGGFGGGALAASGGGGF